MLLVRFDPIGTIVTSTPYHVETSSGLRLASFATQRMAEAYARSQLVKIALDLQQEFGTVNAPAPDGRL